MSLNLYVCAKHVPDTAAAIRVVGGKDIDPDVLFACPAKDHRVKRGETINVKAVLIDPSMPVIEIVG